MLQTEKHVMERELESIEPNTASVIAPRQFTQEKIQLETRSKSEPVSFAEANR